MTLLFCDQTVARYLPDPSLITKPARIGYMNSISSRGICKEDDFGFRQEGPFGSVVARDYL